MAVRFRLPKLHLEQLARFAHRLVGQGIRFDQRYLHSAFCQTYLAPVSVHTFEDGHGQLLLRGHNHQALGLGPPHIATWSLGPRHYLKRQTSVGNVLLTLTRSKIPPQGHLLFKTLLMS